MRAALLSGRCIPHSGHRSPEPRKSYPHPAHNPARQRGIKEPPRPTVVKPPPQPPYIPPTSWLTKRIAVIADVPQDWNGTIPARSGDQIWEFSSPKEWTEALAGTGGRCLLRNGKIIDGLVTWST